MAEAVSGNDPEYLRKRQIMKGLDFYFGKFTFLL